MKGQFKLGTLIMLIAVIFVMGRDAVYGTVNGSCISQACVATGDTSNMTPFLLICAIALVVMVLALLLIKRKKQ